MNLLRQIPLGKITRAEIEACPRIHADEPEFYQQIWNKEEIVQSLGKHEELQFSYTASGALEKTYQDALNESVWRVRG